MNYVLLLRTTLLLALWSGSVGTQAQLAQVAPVDAATARAALLASAARYPKFYRALREVQQQDTLLKKVVLVRNERPNDGPAVAFSNGTVRLDVRYLQSPQPGFDDNRMVVVFYHEIGHLHYFLTVPLALRTPDASERAAFEYSLQQAHRLAEAGDCSPLQAGLRFMLRRSQSTNLGDPHVRALQQIVREPLYGDCRRYIARRCQTRQ